MKILSLLPLPSPSCLSLNISFSLLLLLLLPDFFFLNLSAGSCFALNVQKGVIIREFVCTGSQDTISLRGNDPDTWTVFVATHQGVSHGMKFDLREKQEDKEPGQVKVETGLPSKGRKCLIWNREAKELIIGGAKQGAVRSHREKWKNKG